MHVARPAAASTHMGVFSPLCRACRSNSLRWKRFFFIHSSPKTSRYQLSLPKSKSICSCLPCKRQRYMSSETWSFASSSKGRQTAFGAREPVGVVDASGRSGLSQRLHRGRHWKGEVHGSRAHPHLEPKTSSFMRNSIGLIEHHRYYILYYIYTLFYFMIFYDIIQLSVLRLQKGTPRTSTHTLTLFNH